MKRACLGFHIRLSQSAIGEFESRGGCEVLKREMAEDGTAWFAGINRNAVAEWTLTRRIAVWQWDRGGRFPGDPEHVRRATNRTRVPACAVERGVRALESDPRCHRF